MAKSATTKLQQQKEQQLPITETPNELTDNLDSVGPVGIVRLLRQTDGQLFAGWRHHPCITDSRFFAGADEGGMIEALSKLSEKMLTSSSPSSSCRRGAVVFSGCGTSGRIAWLCAKTYNELAAKAEMDALFHYLIAGGDEALIVSKELPEDDPKLGRDDLAKIVECSDEVLFFGITCGLSAPYVAGQVDYALGQSNVTTVLVGFNPIEMAPNKPIEGWHLTCSQVFGRLRAATNEAPHQNFILNPVVGPEALTGSSRMKGGSMTKIVLDAIFVPPLSMNAVGHRDVVKDLRHVYGTTYYPVEDIAALVSMVTETMVTASGNLYYVGTGSSGCMGLIDASEMVDTFGSRLDEVRAFMVGGWSECSNNEGDISEKGPYFQISALDFEKTVLPGLTADDSIVLLNPHLYREELVGETGCMRALSRAPSRIGVVTVVGGESEDGAVFYREARDAFRAKAGVCISLDRAGLQCVPYLADFSLKLVLNAITTGGMTLRGRVYGNRMINLTVSNNKLFHRSAKIIHEITGCSPETARACLVKSIYRDSGVAADEVETMEISNHCELASTRQNVVPLAILLACGVSLTDAAARFEVAGNAFFGLRELIKERTVM